MAAGDPFDACARIRADDAVRPQASALMLLIRWVILPSMASAFLVAGIGLACQRIFRVSTVLGALVAAGLGVRLTLAMGFFWLSYLQLPFLSSLQLGGGFTTMALDAPGYYALALHGAEDGLASIPKATGSPTYVATLALWMKVFGVSPFSSVLLNLTCYLSTCALVVGVLRSLPSAAFQRVAAATLGAIVCSPMLIFVSTQTLKEPFFLLCGVLLFAGIWQVTSVAAGPAAGFWRRLAPGALAVSAGLFFTAGVRIYFSLIALACYGLSLVAALISQDRGRWRQLLGSAIVTLGVGSAAALLGSGGAKTLVGQVSSLRPSTVATAAEAARRGFAKSGGSTNVAPAVPNDAPAVPKVARPRGPRREGPRRPLRRVAPGRVRERPAVEPAQVIPLSTYASNLGVGLATLFVPLTILRALSVVPSSGPVGMTILMGDADTVFFDIVLAIMWMIVRRLRRESPMNVPYFVFALTCGVLLSALMAYVVTNVGTLVRLRLMVMVPFWTLPFAFSGPLGRFGLDRSPMPTPVVSAGVPTRGA